MPKGKSIKGATNTAPTTPANISESILKKGKDK